MMKLLKTVAILSVFPLAIAVASAAETPSSPYVFKPGHPSLRVWLLPATVPSPAENVTTPARAELGKKLFFDPRLSQTKQSTCVSCHLPERGWSDGFPTSVRFLGGAMERASPSLVNIGYLPILMWDGRTATLEAQADNGMSLSGSMNAGARKDGPFTMIDDLRKIDGYVKEFEKAYPGEGITTKTVSKAVSAFQRTIVSNDSPFDRWVQGDAASMTEQQVRGFELFANPAKGNCAVCHAAPNFTDNGFHNLGLASYGKDKPDVGRYKVRPVQVLHGAFRTPTLRDVELSAPYFHDGSARTMREVVDHYAAGGKVKTNLSAEMRELTLTEQEREDIVAFTRALTTPQKPYVYPVLPQ